jgi:hypothetical protein
MIDPKLKRKWVAALRSQDYPQAYFALSRYQDSTRRIAYCVIGVLCAVSGRSVKDATAGRLGLDDTNRARLQMMNDHHKLDFLTLADYIERSTDI